MKIFVAIFGSLIILILAWNTTVLLVLPWFLFLSWFIDKEFFKSYCLPSNKSFTPLLVALFRTKENTALQHNESGDKEPKETEDDKK